MRKFFKVLVGFMCALAAVTVFNAGVSAKAEQKTDVLYDYEVKSDITDNQSFSYDNGLKIEAEITIPELSIKKHPVITKRINAAVKKFAIDDYVAVYGDAKKAEEQFGTERTVSIEKKYDSITRCGNMITISFTSYEDAEGAAYPYNRTEAVTLNLKTGRAITTMTALFSNVNAVKNVIADEIKTQMKARVLAGDSYLSPSKKEIRKALSIDDCVFGDLGITVYFDEYESFGIHAEGITDYFISYDKFADYIKASRKQLFRPASTYCLMLPYNAGTGYGWEVNIQNKKVVKVASEGSYQVIQDPMLCGGSMYDVYIFSAVKAGKTKITAKLVRAWEENGEAADTREITLVVAKDFSITEK